MVAHRTLDLSSQNRLSAPSTGLDIDLYISLHKRKKDIPQRPWLAQLLTPQSSIWGPPLHRSRPFRHPLLTSVSIFSAHNRVIAIWSMTENHSTQLLPLSIPLIALFLTVKFEYRVVSYVVLFTPNISFAFIMNTRRPSCPLCHSPEHTKFLGPEETSYSRNALRISTPKRSIFRDLFRRSLIPSPRGEMRTTTSVSWI